MNFETLPHDIILQLPGSFGVKDLDFKIRACNQETINMLGYQKLEQIVNLTDYELPDIVASRADVFHKQDKDAIELNEIRLVQIDKFPDGNVHAHIGTKKALLNSSGKKCGLIISSQKIDAAILHDLLGRLSPNTSSHFKLDDVFGSYTVKHDNASKFSLTDRQSEVLFYLMRSYSAKEIASKLALSTKTVETHIANLKLKFNCNRKSQLIEASIELGYWCVLPKSIWEQI